MSGYYNGDEWRWNPRSVKHRPGADRSITVPDSPDAEKAREKAIQDGAVPAPFGFGRELFNANVEDATARLEAAARKGGTA